MAYINGRITYTIGTYQQSREMSNLWYDTTYRPIHYFSILTFAIGPRTLRKNVRKLNWSQYFVITCSFSVFVTYMYGWWIYETLFF